MKSKYVYKGEDLTLDVLMKIEHVVRLIAERESINFDSCYEIFAESATYRALQNMNSLMWTESSQFIVDEYYQERNKKEDGGLEPKGS